jgi:hypothetical protein
MAHETFNFDVLRHGRLVDESGTTVEVITSQAIYHGLDRIECTLVQDEVTRHDMDYFEFSMQDK